MIDFKPTGGQAFPRPEKAGAGMSLRDYFAGCAITIISRTHGPYVSPEVLAEEAFALADAMLVERNKTMYIDKENLMPYIDKSQRTSLNAGTRDPYNAGELNYKITQELNKYLTQRGETYQTYNDMLGALEGAKLELYRRMVSKYEDKKKDLNGDVYNV